MADQNAKKERTDMATTRFKDLLSGNEYNVSRKQETMQQQSPKIRTHKSSWRISANNRWRNGWVLLPESWMMLMRSKNVLERSKNMQGIRIVGSRDSWLEMLSVCYKIIILSKYSAETLTAFKKRSFKQGGKKERALRIALRMKACKWENKWGCVLEKQK